MGEEAPGLNPSDGKPGASRHLEKEISTLRREMGDLLGELDRRRREAFDVRLQLKRHPVAVSLALVGAAAVLGGTVAVLVRSSRRKERASSKAQQLKLALERMVEHPERVARGESPGDKILAAVGSVVAMLLVRSALERALPRPERPPPPTVKA